MAAALGLGFGHRDVAVSIGTSGVASMVTSDPIADGTGAISGFADATGHFLPLVCTLNAARILDLPPSCSAPTTTASPSWPWRRSRAPTV